ncbi:hypothetical protein C8Q80DRAFT_1274735 [Daedaleopsis nitida]|nr:hypothetical protein C8Q80DRAFT_1274735 [Daedaleopsis nitida]
MSNPPFQTIPSRSALVATPNPRSVAEDENQLSYKVGFPSLRPWVRLLSSQPGEEFALNRSVRIVGVQRIPPSPTEYANQTDEWRRTDQDSVYHFVKRSLAKTYYAVKDSLVPHMKLAPSKPGSSGAAKTARSGESGGPKGLYEVGPYIVYYLTEKRSISFLGRTLEVKMHNGVTLIETCSSHPKLPGSRMGSAHNPESLNYIAYIYVEVQRWQETKCKYGCLATSFEPLSSVEVKQLEKRGLEPAWIITADRIPAALRARAIDDINGATVVEDKFE